MRRIPLLLTAAALLLLTACRQSPAKDPVTPPEEELPRQIESLALEFAPVGGEPVSQMKRLRPLEETLKTALAQAGVTVEEVRVTLGASEAATAQSLGQNGVDAAFLPAGLLGETEAVPLAGAAWPLPSCDSEDPADWNGQEISWTTDWAAGRRALLVAGPSVYGRNLASRLSGGAVPTWEELSRACWGVSNGITADLAEQWIEERCEKSLTDLPHKQTYESEDQLLAALAAEEVDLIVILADSRVDAAERWVKSAAGGGWGRGGFIWDETWVIGVTDRAYGSILAVSGESPWEEAPLADALTAAVLSMAGDADLMALSGTERLAALTPQSLPPE